VASSVRLLILVAVAAAILVFAAAIALFPLRSTIQGFAGIAFWTALTLIASALPVRLPRGTVASVSFAPLMATIVLGGPVAAGIVAAIGTTDSRELRGKVPWYGTIYNHASLMTAAVCAGMAFDAVYVRLPDVSSGLGAILSFAALALASLLYHGISGSLAVLAVSARTAVPIRTVWAQDVGAIGPNLIGLAPLGWLMAMVFQLPGGVGWWATTLFVIPLFTTRLAYHRYVEARELFVQTISALANAVDARDKYTRGHSDRVKRISGAMARVMRLPEQMIERIEWAGLLHDIGKIGIRDNILLKPGPLDREERILMNQHPSIGAEIVEPVSQLSAEAPLIRSHHEWFNGSGYPDGIEALDIPLGARLMTIADAYEAMTSSRPYRTTPLSHEQAVNELEKYSGIQFDPEIVPILVGLDRSTLDPTVRPEAELPAMTRDQDAADALRQGQPAQLGAAAGQGVGGTRPRLASDDVS
jgi:putative nucleotidyltransferase with HDIG domain